MDLAVFDGTKNYVNHFYADLWINLEALKIRMNLFVFPMQSTWNQSEKWNGKEEKRMNLSRRFIPNPKSQNLYKEIEAP